MKIIKMNPRHWQYDAYKIEGITLTQKPQEVTAAVADKLLQLRIKAIPLAVEVSKEDLTHAELVALGLYVPPPPEEDDDEPESPVDEAEDVDASPDNGGGDEEDATDVE